MTFRPSSPRAKRRWLALLAFVGVLSVLGTGAVLAQLDKTKFELDKDATNNATYTKIGVLNAAVASATGTSSISICQDVAVVTGYNGATILVDSERMTLAGGVAAGGGGCPAGYTFKVNYTAARGADGTTPGAHAKAEDVSKITTGTIDGADWDQVYAAVNADANTKCVSLGAVECAFTHDARAASIFTSSKDYDEISGTGGEVWQWRDQSVPDADELDDGFAIKYIDSNNKQNLYFGADRFATNGSKDAGFWFFHKDVAAVAPVGTADGLFTGTHTAPSPGPNVGDRFCDSNLGGSVAGGQTSPVPACTYDQNDKGGDVLILTTFTGGGAVTTIRVFEWVGPPGTTAALLERGTQGDCIGAPADAKLCATVNNTTVETNWPYSGKNEPANNNIPNGGLLEGGINLTDLHLEGCFSSFMATTRSAPSLTADPKDFILGSFEACGSSMTTTPKSGAGTALTADSDNDNLDEITIGTNGTVSVKDSAALNVSGTTTFTGSLAFYICGPIATGACSDAGVNAGFSGNPVTTNGTYVSNAVTLTSTGRYCWFATFTSGTQGVPNASDGTMESAGPPKSTGECFEVMPVTPTLLTTAVEPLTLMSPTIYGGKADMNGSGTVTTADDSNAFYGSTSIIDGQLDCNAWGATQNAGTAGNGAIDGADDCTLIGYDGTADGVTIAVVDGQFATADGVAIANGTPLPSVFNATTPNSNSISASNFAWSARFGRVDSNGNESIGGTDCSFDVVGTADILGSDPGCGFGTPIPASLNGYVDLNGDGKATSADTCTGCFLGRNVANGLIQTGPVDFGQPVYDAATLIGTANQPGNNGATNGGNATYPTIRATNGAVADGKITFTLTGPGAACNTTVTATGNPQDVTVSGDGNYATSGVTPGAPGTYHWKAVYSGDPIATPGTNTLGTSHNGTCAETGEDVVVRQIPTEIATGPYTYPQDSASIRSSITTDLLPAGGTVVFKLFGPTTGKTGLENCQANTSTGLVYSETKTSVVPSGGAHEVTGINTSNSSFSIDSSKNGLYYWLVTYATGDQVHTSRQSACTESTSVTQVDAAYPGTLFTP